MIKNYFSQFIEKKIIPAIDKQITSKGLTIINTETNEKKSVIDDFLTLLYTETIPLDKRAFNINKPYNWSQNNLFKVISRGIKQTTSTETPPEKIENDIQNYFSRLSEEQQETVKEYTLKDYEENGYYIFQNPHKPFTFNSLIDDTWQRLNEGYPEEAKKHTALLNQNTEKAFGLSQAALFSFTAKSLNDVLDLGFDYTPDYETNRVSDKTIEILNFSTYSIESRCLIREADLVHYEKIISSVLSQMLSISDKRADVLDNISSEQLEIWEKIKPVAFYDITKATAKQDLIGIEKQSIPETILNTKTETGLTVSEEIDLFNTERAFFFGENFELKLKIYSFIYSIKHSLETQGGLAGINYRTAEDNTIIIKTPVDNNFYSFFLERSNRGNYETQDKRAFFKKLVKFCDSTRVNIEFDRENNSWKYSGRRLINIEREITSKRKSFIVLRIDPSFIPVNIKDGNFLRFNQKEEQQKKEGWKKLKTTTEYKKYNLSKFQDTPSRIIITLKLIKHKTNSQNLSFDSLNMFLGDLRERLEAHLKTTKKTGYSEEDRTKAYSFLVKKSLEITKKAGVILDYKVIEKEEKFQFTYP